LRSAKELATFAAFVALAGCSFAPAYHPPSTPTPPAYKEVSAPPPAGWLVAEPGDAAERGTWWRSFGDATLDDLETRVERASPTLAAALARYDAARAQVRAAGADLYPTPSIGASAERDRVSARRPLSNGAAATYKDFIVGGSIDYELDLWGRVRNEVKATRAEAQASAADLADVRLSLQAQLADTYFRLRGLDAEAALLRQTIDAYARAESLTRTRHRGGLANGMDVGRAETVLASARAELSAIANQRAAAEHRIAALVGENATAFTLAPAVLALTPPEIPAGVPSALLQRRPDIAEAERRIYAANARIGVARAAFFPSLTLGVGGGFNAAHGALLSTPATFWALGPAQALLTLFDGGRRRAQVAISRAHYEEVAADYRAIVLAAFQQVEDGLAAQRLLAQESEDRHAAADAARRTESLALTRYRDGASDYLEVVTAQTAALDAERAALAVDTQRMQAAVALVRALGGRAEENATRKSA